MPPLSDQEPSEDRVYSPQPPQPPTLCTPRPVRTQRALVHVLAAGRARVPRGAGADGLAVDGVGVTVGALVARVADAGVIEVAQQAWVGRWRSAGHGLSWPGDGGRPHRDGLPSGPVGHTTLGPPWGARHQQACPRQPRPSLQKAPRPPQVSSAGSKSRQPRTQVRLHMSGRAREPAEGVPRPLYPPPRAAPPPLLGAHRCGREDTRSRRKPPGRGRWRRGNRRRWRSRRCSHCSPPPSSR